MNGGLLAIRYFLSFGYPTVCARVISCPGRSFIAFASAGFSIHARITVTNIRDYPHKKCTSLNFFFL